MAKQQTFRSYLFYSWKEKLLNLFDALYLLFSSPLETEVLIEKFGNKNKVFSVTTFIAIRATRPLSINNLLFTKKSPYISLRSSQRSIFSE